MTSQSLTRLWTTRWTDAGVAVLALVGGYVEYLFAGIDVGGSYPGSTLLVILAMPVAAGFARRRPAVSLGVVWALALLHLGGDQPILYTELATIVLVAFGVARWGRPGTATAAALSIPAVLLLGLAALVLGHLGGGYFLVSTGLLGAGVLDDRGIFGSLFVGITTLGVPFMAGLALRSQATADDSRRGQQVAESERDQAQVQADQAQEIARLRADQATLARDVHDVVGHSLAVILAQAESAQYLPDDPTQLKTTLATIATSARGSLQDVRQVLSATTATPAPATAKAGGIETLVAGIRASGQEVVVDEIGNPQPLPPDLEVVAHRVLQEMLTNAVKHGTRARPIRVERHWPGGGFEQDLRIEVVNTVGPAPAPDETQPITAGTAAEATPGQGIDGMRRRVESVGGRLDVRRRAAPDDTDSFTATAWVPVRR